MIAIVLWLAGIVGTVTSADTRPVCAKGPAVFQVKCFSICILVLVLSVHIPIPIAPQ